MHSKGRSNPHQQRFLEERADRDDARDMELMNRKQPLASSESECLYDKQRHEKPGGACDLSHRSAYRKTSILS